MFPPRPFYHIALALLLTATTIHTATPPVWWSDPATAILAPGAAAHDYSPANLGQLKFVASQAKKFLDLKLSTAGGAGPQVNAVCQFGQAGNYSPVTVGQLKFVAKPFYDRLAAMHCNWHEPGTYGVPTPLYPWSSTTNPSNAAPATLGQLKFVFAFDLSPTFLAKDTDNDGLHDWHEYLVGTNIANADSDGDGWSDLFEVQTGSNPILATSLPSESDDPDGDGLDNYWERELGLQPGNADTDGDGLSDGDEDADNDGVKNRLDAHPMRPLIAWSRVAESRYIVVPLENGFAPYASRNPKFWHLNDGGDVVGFADPASPDSSRPGYRVPIVWTNGAWATLGGAGLLEVLNASRSDVGTTQPVRFYTREGGTEAPIQIDNDRRIAAVAQLQDKVKSPHAPNWGSSSYASSLIWQPVSGSVGSTPVPIGRNTAWQNTSLWNSTTAFDTNGMVASIASGGVVLVNSAYVSASDGTHRRVSASPSSYQNLGIRGTPVSQNFATGTGSSSDGFVCGNFNNVPDLSNPYAVWTPSSVIHTFPHLPPHPSGMSLPLAIQRLAKGPGSPASDPLVVLDGNGRLAVSTNWSQPVILGITNSNGAAAEVLDLAATTINTRGEILWPWNTFLPNPAPPPRLWRNGRLHFVNNLLHTTTWTVFAVHHLNNHGVILATASSPTSSAQPVLLIPIDIEPDVNMAGVVGDVIKSTIVSSSVKHFVTPKMSTELDQQYVVLKATGIAAEQITPGNAQQIVEWDGGEAAVPADPLKRRVNRDASGKTVVKIRIKSGGATVAQMPVWVVWVDLTSRFTGTELDPNNSLLFADTSSIRLGEQLNVRPVYKEYSPSLGQDLNVYETNAVQSVEWKGVIQPVGICITTDEVPDLTQKWPKIGVNAPPMEDGRAFYTQWDFTRDRIKRIAFDGQVHSSSDSGWTGDDIGNLSRDCDPYDGPRNSPSGSATGQIFSIDNPGLGFLWRERESGVFEFQNITANSAAISHNFYEFVRVRLNGKWFVCSAKAEWHSAIRITRPANTSRSWSIDSAFSKFGTGHQTLPAF